MDPALEIVHRCSSMLQYRPSQNVASAVVQCPRPPRPNFAASPFLALVHRSAGNCWGPGAWVQARGLGGVVPCGSSGFCSPSSSFSCRSAGFNLHFTLSSAESQNYNDRPRRLGLQAASALMTTKWMWMLKTATFVGTWVGFCLHGTDSGSHPLPSHKFE